jgi:ArsR family transcriptional regulator
MRALGLPAERVEQAIIDLLPTDALGRVLDIGTGTGRLLELLAPRASSALGIDASRAMLTLARARLASPELQHCGVRQADMYRLPLADASHDVAILQMVLHYAEDPLAVLREAARVLKPGGRLLVIDLAAHQRHDLTDKLAHRWPGFTDKAMKAMLRNAGLEPNRAGIVAGPLEIVLWPAELPIARRLEVVA